MKLPPIYVVVPVCWMAYTGPLGTQGLSVAKGADEELLELELLDDDEEDDELLEEELLELELLLEELDKLDVEDELGAGDELEEEEDDEDEEEEAGGRPQLGSVLGPTSFLPRFVEMTRGSVTFSR